MIGETALLPNDICKVETQSTQLDGNGDCQVTGRAELVEVFREEVFS